MSKPSREEIFGISLYDFMVLYTNLYMAKNDKDIGYVDYETPMKLIEARLRKAGHQIKQSELEAALWACTLLDEAGKFWHPNGQKAKDFVTGLLHHKQAKKYYDEIYSQIKDKPKMGRPLKEGNKNG